MSAPAPCIGKFISKRGLKDKIAKLKEEMQRLRAIEAQMLATPDQQISLTDPDALDGDEWPWLRRGWLQRPGRS
jgi:hypothetical protein